MKGNNTIVMNTATMLEAIQLWLDANFKSPPVAAAISETKNGGSPSFHISLTERPKNADDPATAD